MKNDFLAFPRVAEKGLRLHTTLLQYYYTVGDNRGLRCSRKFRIHEAGYSSLTNPELPTSRSWRLCHREARASSINAGSSNFKSGISTIDSGSSTIDCGTSSFAMLEVPPSWSWKFWIYETGVSSFTKQIDQGSKAPPTSPFHHLKIEPSMFRKHLVCIPRVLEALLAS